MAMMKRAASFNIFFCLVKVKTPEINRKSSSQSKCCKIVTVTFTIAPTEHLLGSLQTVPREVLKTYH